MYVYLALYSLYSTSDHDPLLDRVDSSLVFPLDAHGSLLVHMRCCAYPPDSLVLNPCVPLSTVPLHDPVESSLISRLDLLQSSLVVKTLVSRQLRRKPDSSLSMNLVRYIPGTLHVERAAHVDVLPLSTLS